MSASAGASTDAGGEGVEGRDNEERVDDEDDDAQAQNVLPLNGSVAYTACDGAPSYMILQRRIANPETYNMHYNINVRATTDIHCNACILYRTPL